MLSDDKFKISTGTQDTLNNVEVTGPADKIELLRQKNFPAAVVVDLTEKPFDFAAITTSAEKPITLKLENYRDASRRDGDEPHRDITISITRRGN